MSVSEKKAQAIYDAVHEVLMRVRIEVERRVILSNELAPMLANAQHQAAMCAVAAYRKPLHAKPKRKAKERSR